MTDAIEQAIAAAKAAGTSAPAANVPATAPATQVTQFTQPAGTPTVLSAGQMMQGSFSVDAYIKVSEDGIKIGDKPGLITDALKASIDLSEVFYYYAVKYGQNPSIYEKTANQVTSFTGKPWGSVLDTAARVDGPKFKGAYRSADVPMVLLEDAKDFKGNLVETAGTRLGKSLSTTEWKEFEGFLRSVTKSGLNIDLASVDVEIGFKQRKNATNTWGVLTFKLIGESTPADVAA